MASNISYHLGEEANSLGSLGFGISQILRGISGSSIRLPLMILQLEYVKLRERATSVVYSPTKPQAKGEDFERDL
jgi:hypothetical protein